MFFIDVTNPNQLIADVTADEAECCGEQARFSLEN